VPDSQPLFDNQEIQASLVNFSDSLDQELLLPNSAKDFLAEIERIVPDLSQMSFGDFESIASALALNNRSRVVRSEKTQSPTKGTHTSYVTATTAPALITHIMNQDDRDYYSDLIDCIEDCQNDGVPVATRDKNESKLRSRMISESSKGDGFLPLRMKHLLKPQDQLLWLSPCDESQCRSDEFLNAKNVDRKNGEIARDVLGLEHLYDDRYCDKLLVCLRLSTKSIPESTFLARPSALDGGNERFRVGYDVLYKTISCGGGLTVDLDLIGKDDIARGCIEFVSAAFAPLETVEFSILGSLRKDRLPDNTYVNYLELLHALNLRKGGSMSKLKAAW